MDRYTLYRAGMEADYGYELTYIIEDELITVSRYFDIPNYGRAGKEYTISLEEMRARQEWKDSCTWVVTFAGMPGRERMSVVNFTAENFAARRHEYLFSDLHTGLHLCAGIFAPFASCSFSEMFHQVNMQEKNGVFTSNREFTEVVTENHGQGTGPTLPTTKFFPKLALDFPDAIGADAWIEGTVRATHLGAPLPDGATVEVFLDCVNGYLPKTRLIVGKDPAPFKLSAMGLEAGDEIRLRAGFRYRSSVAEKIINVGISG